MTRKEEIKEMAEITASHITSDKDMQVAFADALRRGAEWADAHPHWISVKDKLPPREKDVLIWSSGWNEAMIGYYKNWNWQRKTNVFHSYFDNGIWFNITHWMPIPQPPKKGDEK